MDAKTIFLNGELNEEIFTKQPEVFIQKVPLTQGCSF